MAQKTNQAPAAVEAAFVTKFPHSSAGKWEKEGDVYETKVKTDGATWEVAFDANGTWLESEKKVSASQVPAEVKQALTDMKLEGWKVSEWEETQSPDYTLAYEATLKKKKETKTFIFAPSGKLLKEDK